jgi:hypothetical protein
MNELDEHVFPFTDNTFDEDRGMTLRDYFAAKAMQAHISGACAWTLPSNLGCGGIAAWAYGMADEMLRARGRGQE